ncbi:MAG TPA: hypothetical protein VFB96_12535 [Pirellulaceae bacterium]|nr:hypothetical protein [Pirellulaceae bacterium]
MPPPTHEGHPSQITQPISSQSKVIPPIYHGGGKGQAAWRGQRKDQ